MMQTPKAKQVIKLANLEKEIPKSEVMVKVSTFLNPKDEKFIEDYAIGRICVSIGDSMFFLSKNHHVPSEAKLVRQEEGEHVGQIIGIPAVVGG